MPYKLNPFKVRLVPKELRDKGVEQHAGEAFVLDQTPEITGARNAEEATSGILLKALPKPLRV